MLASQRGCLQLSWTGQSPKVERFHTTLRGYLPRNVTFIRCLEVGGTVQLTRPIMVMAVPSYLFAQKFVSIPIPSGGQVKQTLEKIQKDFESNKAYSKVSKITKQIVKHKKLYKLHETHQGEVLKIHVSEKYDDT